MDIVATLPDTHTQDPRTNLQPPQRFQEKPREAQEVNSAGPSQVSGWKILGIQRKNQETWGQVKYPEQPEMQVKLLNGP